VFCTGTSTADPAVDADAPLAIAKDTPATPNAGAALFRLFRFELFFAGAIRVLPYLIVVAVVLPLKHSPSPTKQALALRNCAQSDIFCQTHFVRHTTSARIPASSVL
jgi:hypothetical protein